MAPKRDHPLQKRQKIGTLHSQSVFATCILLKWAWGTLSAPDVQELAMACKLAGNDEAEVDELASIGGYGLNGKQHRDLMIRFSTDLLPPLPRKIKVPYVDVKGDVTVQLETEVAIFPK